MFDPWRFGQAAQELRQRGIPVLEFQESDSRIIPASDRLYRAIVEARLILPDHEELRQHAANAIARHSRRGSRLDKAGRTDNIDSIIALCMRRDDRPEAVPLHFLRPLAARWELPAAGQASVEGAAPQVPCHGRARWGAARVQKKTVVARAEPKTRSGRLSFLNPDVRMRQLVVKRAFAP